MPHPTATSTSSLLEFVSGVLEQEYGRARWLCYGAVSSSANLQHAQQIFLGRITTLVTEKLKSAGNCLLSGPDAGYLAGLLAENRVKCISIGCGAGAASEATEQSSDYLSVSGNGVFDGIVLEGTVHYLDQLRYLQKARRLLVDGGMLLMAGEYLADDSLVEPSALANLSSCYQLSERLGFRLCEDIDYSADAESSLEMIMEMARRHERALVHPSGASDGFSASMNELRRMREEYGSGRRAYRLLLLEKQPHSDGEYADAEFGDRDSFSPAELASLFQDSFSEPFDEGLWRWKYAENNGRCVVARKSRDGPIVSHYGGAPRRIDYFGREALAIQVCDVMVQPEHRSHYGRSSLFFKTAATFLEREIGNTVKHLLGFGFPNQKAMNIATRLGLYEKTDDFVELCFDAESIDGQPGKVLELDFTDVAHRQRLDTLWLQMRADFEDRIIGHRDWQYCAYRYFRHPHNHRFRVSLLENGSGDALAVAATRAHEGDLLLMDLVCPVINIEAALSVLRAVMLNEEPQRRLRFWVTRGALDLLPVGAAIVNDLGIEIPCNSWNPGPEARKLFSAWWLTAGDMDFM